MGEIMKTALLINADKYGLYGVPCGIIEASLTFNPKKRNFSIGDGRSVDVHVSDLVIIVLSDCEKKRLFPLCY
tara:strand:- start:332 stop:550 length:219 start_codon:yes stop_codon:yes gene_type:complete